MKTKTILAFFGISLLFSFQENMETLDFEFADNYCRTIEQQIAETGKKYELVVPDLLPIVYPECSRFNALSNVFEEDLLSYLYVQNGPDKANFSIGYFQMKPSFVEELEMEIQKNDLFLNHRQKFQYSTSTLKDERNERLDRLESQEWQIEYLCAFVVLMKERYKVENIAIPETNFIAASYNYGFDKSTAEIINWSKVRAFPNGKTSSFNYVYSELAQNYKFNNYGHE